MPNYVYGTNGSDIIDTLSGATNGADVIYGYNGNDFIWASGGADTIYGGNGDDYINGGSGNDLMIGGNGADQFNGGTGVDTVSYDDSTEGVIVSLVSGEGFGGTAEDDTLANVENVTGSWYADMLVGDNGNNVLAGLGGNDTLKGGGGSDTLYGDSGNDTLKGGGGADTLNGGSGVDTASYGESSAGVFVSLYHDLAADGDAEGDELNSIENLTGSGFADNLWGSDGVNVLRGNDGNDSLKGFGGSDSIYGGDHNDALYGMDGNDSLYGENGNDTIIGGAGQDLMYGGAGADTFEFRLVSDAAPLGYGFTDYIPDFNQAQGDLIDLSEIDANTGVGGDQAFSFIGNGVDFSGTAGEVRFNTYYGFVEGDVNGDAVADFQIELDILSMNASDFIL
jgi:Ca2+-binding RTX toxin-like protein